MRIRAGYEIAYECPAETPMLLMLNVRPERLGDLETPDLIKTEPYAPIRQYVDTFGNLCTRLVAPAGRIVFRSEFIVRDSGEQAYAAELHRVYGELLLKSGSSDSVPRAEECFERGVAIAREQRARSWELKTVTSLCRLTSDRHDRGYARRLLRETYDRFTEGQQTADLKAARRAAAGRMGE